MIPMVTASAVAFWICAPLIVAGGLGVILNKKPVYSALSLAVVMICLAIQYAAQDAPFLFVVQIIVYTGAILMLFLFVVMLLGVDTSDSLAETIKHHRGASLLAVAGFVLLLVRGVIAITGTEAIGLATANQDGNILGLAKLIFTRYVFIFEATAGLLITAALAAMVLAHGEKIREKIGQREAAALRIKNYAKRGVHPGPMPSSGVFANRNSIATPALLPDGSIAPTSVSKTLVDRGVVVSGTDLSKPAVSTFLAIERSYDEAEGEAE